MTNTKAIGAKIRDGILTTPYRRVLKNSRGEIESISTEVTYMDAQEEAQYRIGDILSLKKEAIGTSTRRCSPESLRLTIRLR